MRVWIDYLITNSGACNDFLAWAKEIEQQLSHDMALAVRADNMEKARALAHEMKVYDTIYKKVNSELRERSAQVQHDQERG